MTSRFVLACLLFFQLVLQSALPALACEGDEKPAARQLLAQSEFLFKGTITKSESMDIEAIAPEVLRSEELQQAFSGPLIFFKVHWRLDNAFKGKPSEDAYAIAIGDLCNPSFPAVGSQHVLSIVSVDFSRVADPAVGEVLRKIYQGSLGHIDSNGSISVLNDVQRLEELAAEFKSLGK